MIKEKPPDSSQRPPTIQNRGKFLNSSNRMKSNLLSLGTCKTLLMTKKFAEGGYDVDIMSTTTTQDMEIWNKGHDGLAKDK